MMSKMIIFDIMMLQEPENGYITQKLIGDVQLKHPTY